MIVAVGSGRNSLEACVQIALYGSLIDSADKAPCCRMVRGWAARRRPAAGHAPSSPCRASINRGGPPKIGQLRDVVWLYALTSRPQGAADADYEPAGGLLGDRSRERGAAYHLCTRYAELIDSPRLAQLEQNRVRFSISQKSARVRSRA
jgi:hypothetical protein